ncbi:MAG: hypothetical protein HYX41_03140 [Bdellovibrio sp.]|nr:hypothetical protein [Bdellovibrio sp.]
MGISKSNRGWLLFLFISLSLGALLRLIWGLDIEYKYDEQFMFEQSQTREFWEAWFHSGMLAGVQIPNPGLSIAVFVALAKIFGATTPPELAQAVQILNTLALFFLAWFAFSQVEKQVRESWLWGTALVCVSPIAVLLQRKIWAQSVLPLFCMTLIFGWHWRNKRWGAFLWGVIGALVGQIHLSGFFVAFAVFVWTWAKKYPVRWKYWLVGSVLGALPLIPWAFEILSQGKLRSIPASGLDIRNLVECFWEYWATDSLGVGLSYSLHKNEFFQFWKYPYFFNSPTFLVGIAHLILIGMGLKIFFTSLKDFFVQVKSKNKRTQLFLGPDQPSTSTLEKASFWGFGPLLHLTGVRVTRHYLIMTFPLEWVWLARLALARDKTRKLLPWIWGLQLFVSALFLYYIHINHGALTGDFGPSYRYQMESGSQE